MAPFTKKRKLIDRPVEELKFDNSARDEYLTGFSKRKAARKEAAKEAAIKREKEEKVRERKQIRDQRKEDLESHVAAINDELRKQNAILNGEEDDDDDEFSGFDDSTIIAPVEAAEELPDDAEYIDEDKYTTVTVEAMGDEDDEEVDQEAEKARYAAKAETDQKPQKKKRPWDKGGDDKSKVKKKKFRYESKAERAVTRQKQKSKNQKFAKARREG